MNNKKIRGWIIRILERAYPLGLEGQNIHKQLHELGYAMTKKDFDANISYLIEDKFVEIKKFGNEFEFADDILSNKIYKLTTKGIDLAEKSITDDGVEL